MGFPDLHARARPVVERGLELERPKRTKVGVLLLVLAISLLGLGPAGCGGSTAAPASTEKPPTAGAQAFGHPAGGVDSRAIRTLAERYYATAAAADGVRACALLYVIRRETIPEEFGQTSGPASLHGTTCPTVMAKLFRLEHRQLVAESTNLRVIAIRVEGKRGYALLQFGGSSELHALAVHDEIGVWRVESLLADPVG